MPVKPFWAAFRALLESAGCDLTPISQKPGDFVKPVIVVRFGGAIAADVGAAIVPAFAESVGSDPFLTPDRIQIDMVVGGQVLRDCKPTNYAVGEFLRTVNYYLNEVSK